MSAITKFAEGQPCTIRLPGICNHDPATSVMAHVPNGIRFGKGIGKKPSDLLVAICCFNCHNVVDSRVKTNLEKEFIELQWWRAHGETLILLEKAGIIKI